MLAMPSKFKRFIQSWIINTAAVLLAALVLRGHIQCQKTWHLFAASLLLGILNAVLRPMLLLLALPLLIFTLGLFTFVINGLVLYFVGFLLQPYFSVDSFWSAFWGALIISFVSLILNALTGGGGFRVEVRDRRRPPGSDRGGNGPVIDV
jgi:putative membrane protein